MPFTREQQREHYLKNQELLKAKRRERYLVNKNQVEQITVTKVEQSQVEQLLAKNVQPKEKVEQNLKIEQINTTKEKVVDKINNSVVDIQAFNEKVYQRARTSEETRFYTFSDGRKIVRTMCGCNPTRVFYDWCLDNCQYFTNWINHQIKANE